MAYKLSLVIFQFILICVNCNLVWETPNDALDNALYESVLDPVLCQDQLAHLRENFMLMTRFLDSGIRTPRGILTGNTYDLGNYHQCLGIHHEWEEAFIQGKYCRIRVPMSQSFEFSPGELLRGDFDPNSLKMENVTRDSLEEFLKLTAGLRAMDGIHDERFFPDSPLSGVTFGLSICIPQPCTTEETITGLLFNVSSIGFQYEDEFCRLPNDKPWAPADYTAVVVFFVLGIVTVFSTSYDIYQTLILKNDPKTVSVYGRLFSVMTNGKRLMNFSSGSGTLDCLNGIRALAMIWVILGHAFTTEPHWANPLDTFEFTVSFGALWVTGAHITVDTFFFLSGLLVVYTTAGKLTGMNLLKNLHLFYLNRLLRMFPLLAAGVLLEASFFHRVTDGPDWGMIVTQVDGCRTFWWSTLLHIQNYLNPTMTCLVQTWYLAIDVQLHIVSPLVLFWVLRGRKSAWIALAVGLIAILTASTTYNFIKNFPSSITNPIRFDQFQDYINQYYINALTRASPFFVGMIVGYILHERRDQKMNISKVIVASLWTLSFALMIFVMYTNYPILQTSWDNQILDNLYNSFIRPIWAVALGIMIFLCIHGYGGPINWLLSLDLWKLIARISYAMYIFHFAMMTAINCTAITPFYFTPGLVTFKALAHLFLTITVAFFLTLLIDSPFSTLFKQLLSKGSRNNKQKSQELVQETKRVSSTKEDT